MPAPVSNWTHVMVVSSASNPTVTDDTAHYRYVGQMWVNTSTDVVYVCADATNGAAVWKDLSTTVTLPINESDVTNLVADLAARLLDVQAPGSFTIPTVSILTKQTRLTLTGAQRVTMQGTGRFVNYDAVPPNTKRNAVGSFTLVDGLYLLQPFRLTLVADQRVTLLGNSRTITTDFTPGSRIVTAGRGY